MFVKGGAHQTFTIKFLSMELLPLFCDYTQHILRGIFFFAWTNTENMWKLFFQLTKYAHLVPGKKIKRVLIIGPITSN